MQWEDSPSNAAAGQESWTNTSQESKVCLQGWEMVGLETSEILLQKLEGTSSYDSDLLRSLDQERVTVRTQSGGFPKRCVRESAFCGEEGRSARRLRCYTSTWASTCECSCLICIPSWHRWSKLRMLTCTCHSLLWTTKRRWIWCAPSLRWSPCTGVGQVSSGSWTCRRFVLPSWSPLHMPVHPTIGNTWKKCECLQNWDTCHGESSLACTRPSTPSRCHR